MTTQSEAQSCSAYADCIIGAAVFDLNGLPKQYFSLAQSNTQEWMQAIFQALGLRSLLMASLQLEGFHHALIHSGQASAVIVRQSNCYTALLLSQSCSGQVNPSLIEWIHGFNCNSLRQDSRFQVI